MVGETTGKTSPLKSDGHEHEQEEYAYENENENENEYVNEPSSNHHHDSVLAGSSDSLSPVKPTKLGLTSSAAAAAAADAADDADGLGSQPSFKQLITRFHHIVKDNNREESPDYDARDQIQDQGYEESEAENEEEPSTELLALADKNDIMQDELTILQSKIAKLDKQLVLEKAKKAKLSAQITQLSELLETVFKGYESMHATVSDLRQENTDLHQSVSQHETRIAAFDDTLKSELESLAQELYIQYAEKHEAKIAKLRAAYESKYTKKQATFRDRFQLLQDQQETLKQELAHVKNRLQVETSEKRQLVKLWDEYVALDKKDVDEMSNFVKRLK
ncbi:hypothetical protein PMKS-003017 [Pichia membranifaciens]|uniref:Uncharacterized protein n=1 Tax=Pichia membranifaciens TaxID=4926 RepID=A0A1Q2YIY3_9ASCO|nr:hypothetical protein PMKS-003017 [Pichia membranifaciens]